MVLLLGPALRVEFAQLPRPPGVVPEPFDPGPYSVYVADWGHHTSIILQQPAGWRLGPANQPAAYVEFAWGNRSYYMSVHPSVLTGLAALFIPSKSVTYVEGWASAPDAPGSRARRLAVRRVSGAELRALATALGATFDRHAPFPPVPGYGGRFYASAEPYLWWYDCNRWTADRLADAGLATGGRGVLLSRQVFGRLLGFETAIPRR